MSTVDSQAPACLSACSEQDACPPMVCDNACCLHQLQLGAWGRVLRVGGESDVRRRLLEMGFCCGTSVRMVRRSPFGDPIEFCLRGYYLSLREDQARHVTIEPLKDGPGAGV